MKKILPHISLVLSVTMIIFIILDWFNPFMNFTYNDFSQKILILLCFIALLNGIYTIYLQRKEFKYKEKIDASTLELEEIKKKL